MRRFSIEKLENIEAPIAIPLTKWWHYALAVAAIVVVVLL